jgi:hypothetical protein
MAFWVVRREQRRVEVAHLHFRQKADDLIPPGGQAAFDWGEAGAAVDGVQRLDAQGVAPLLLFLGRKLRDQDVVVALSP